jgi:sigma-B regulation protein RsbU (phosphoserine phosphatase)
MIDIRVEEEPKIKFQQTRLGFITQYIEPVSSNVGLEAAKSILLQNPEYNSLPIERDGGVVGLIDRDTVMKKSESAIEVMRNRGLDVFLRETMIMDTMESVDTALTKALERKVEHVDRDFLIYHYGKFLGVGNFLKLLRHADFLRNRDFAEAQASQQHLVDMGSAECSGFEVWPFLKMAHELGGDIHQTIDLGNGNYLVACFDVSGKGLAASLTTCLISSFFSTMKISGGLKDADPDKLVRMLNELLVSSTASGKFVVGALVFIDVQGRKLRIYNMALGPIYLYLTGEGGKALLSVVQPTGEPLGLDAIDDMEKKRKIIPIKEGMRIFLFTDGLTDARNSGGLMYGEETVKEFLTARFHSSAKTLMAELAAEMANFIGSAPQADDITAITIQF